MIQLFVGSKRVDLFKDENIEIQDSIQDAKDIGKIFTTFSRTFTVPANKNNNNVFQNFYNFDVVNGFDPREKVRSVITKNGATYRNGFIQIRKVKLKNNKPTSYTIFFTGLLSTLKDKLQDDRLSDLVELNNYDHVYSQANVETAFEDFASVDNDNDLQADNTDLDICYPFISVDNRYGFRNDGLVKRFNNNGNLPTGNGGNLDYKDLKPAIRLVRIIEAIEGQYNINFSDDFFASVDFTGLYLWLNRNKGKLGEEVNLNLKIFITDFNFQSGGEQLTSNTINVYNVNSNNSQKYRFIYLVQVIGIGEGITKIIDNLTNNVLAEEQTDFNNNQIQISFTFEVDPNENRDFEPYISFTTEGGITDVDIFLSSKRTTETAQGPVTVFGFYSQTFQAVNSVEISKQIPKLKVIDFLTSIFKMFNLTANVVDDVVKVQTLDSFYDDGDNIDITRFVDISNLSVSKVDTIKRFNFKHEEATTLLLLKGNELQDFEYGNLEEELEENPNLVLGGKTLDIETKFYKILYERLRSQNGTLSNISFGWYVDDNEEQLSNEPILFYPEKIFNANDAIEFKNSNFKPIDYMAPLNASNSFVPNLTTNFSNEKSEFNFADVQGLFNRFYSKYVARVFSPQSRKVELEAVLRDDFILSYKLNDIIIYKNRRHLINDISINLNTNKAKLTLLNIPIEVINFTANDDRSESLGLSVSNISAVTQGELITFDIVSDSDWEIEILVNWMTTETPTGSGNQTVSLGIAENTTGNARTGDVKVKTENLEQTITVEQAG